MDTSSQRVTWTHGTEKRDSRMQAEVFDLELPGHLTWMHGRMMWKQDVDVRCGFVM